MAKNDPYKLTLPRVKTLVAVVDKGLTCGLGDPEPGKMCVEAAVCYAFGESHSDRPSCVDDEFIQAKIDINDDWKWKNDKDRARGLRRLAIIQLGTATMKGFTMSRLWDKAHRLAMDDLFKGRLAKVGDPSGAVDALSEGINGPSSVLDVYQNEHVACEKIVQAAVALKVPARKYLKLAPYDPPKGTPSL
jgi:hypothetical protein